MALSSDSVAKRLLDMRITKRRCCALWARKRTGTWLEGAACRYHAGLAVSAPHRVHAPATGAIRAAGVVRAAAYVY